MYRRHLLGLSVTTLVACAFSNPSPKASRPLQISGQPTIVLVHGAWHGGWCWALVEPHLRAAGARVYTPTLTGLGRRAHLRTPVPGLSTHIEDVVRLIEWQELDDVVLVGHSYGGMVVTAVADRLKDRIRHVVYLDAALPRDGDSMITQGAEVTPDNTASTLAQLTALAPDGVWMQPFPAAVFGIPPERSDLTAWVDRRLTPHPLPSWTEPVRLPNGGAEGLARTFILCTNPVLPRSAFPGHAARIRKGDAGTGWRYRELDTGHDAMILAPEQVALEILEAAIYPPHPKPI